MKEQEQESAKLKRREAFGHISLHTAFAGLGIAYVGMVSATVNGFENVKREEAGQPLEPASRRAAYATAIGGIVFIAASIARISSY